MGLPFNPPNPYGAYFNFNSVYGGDPTPSLWRQPNYPNLGTPTSQGVAAAMGSPSGGINPTEREFIDSRRRDIAYQSFIDRAIKDDPRTRVVGNMLLDGIYGNDARAKMMAMARVGGADAYQGLIGTVMNTPGLSGYFGGSARSLAIGSLAVGTSGLTMNGYGVFGDKPMNMRFADELMRQVNSRFYGSNGNPILSMTNGLNRDQMGGVMVQAASQGAFTGMDMGFFQKLDPAGKTAKFMANGDTVQKITDFVKNVTKSLGSLIDVYGNISSGELMQKAQQITGLDLSRLGNAQIMGDRIQRLRDTARVTGIDTQSAFDMAARSVDYGSSIGLRPEMAGTIGNFAANQGMRDFRARQLNVHGFYTNTISPMEMNQSIVRDQAAMSQDPMGARFAAMEMLIKSRGMGANAAEVLRGQAAGLSANAAGVSTLDSLIQSNFGVSAAGLIRSMGGPAALQQQLDPTQQENLAAMNYRNLGARQSGLIRSNLFRGGLMTTGSSAAQINAMHRLVTTFDNDTIEKILGAGSDSDLAGIINPLLGNNTGDIINSAKTIRGMGDNGITSYHNVRSSIQANELTRGFVTKEGRLRNAYMDMDTLSDDFRGQLLGGGFIAGMLDKYSGNDPMSKLLRLYKVRPDVVAGLGANNAISMNFGSFNQGGKFDAKSWRKAAFNWRAGLERTPEGELISRSLGLQGDMSETMKDSKGGVSDKTLAAAFEKLRDPDWRLDNMSNYDFFSLNNGSNIAFARKSDMANNENLGSAITLKALAQNLTDIGGSDAQVKDLMTSATALATGGWYLDRNNKWTKVPAAYLNRAKHSPAKTFVGGLVSGINWDDAAFKAITADKAASSEASLLIEKYEDIFKQDMRPGQDHKTQMAALERAKAKLGAGAPAPTLDMAQVQQSITGTLLLKDEGSAGIVAKLQGMIAQNKNSTQ